MPTWLIAADTPATTMTPFFWAALILGVGLLVWNTIEVGRNDAANVVNAVFGSRILARRWMVRVAALGVVLGAASAPGGVDPARLGAFEPRAVTYEQAIAVYLSVYIVNAMVLYACSAFSAPVSTTSVMVATLSGAAAAVSRFEGMAVIPTILGSMAASIVLAGILAFAVQRVVRALLGDEWRDPAILCRHGGWVAAALVAPPAFFMLSLAARRSPETALADGSSIWDSPLALPGIFVALSIVLYAGLRWSRRWVAQGLFPGVALVGTLGMAYLLGRNELANAAGPGASILSLIDLRRDGASMADFVQRPLPRDALFGCGIMLVMGMMTEHAQRVTRALVRMGSMGDHVKLYATQRCIRAARRTLSLGSPAPSRAPIFTKTPWGKTLHYDPMRACVIVMVSATVVAAATAQGVVLSATYVVFSAVLATGTADRVFRRGDAVLKLGRAYLCILLWIGASAAAFAGSVAVCLVIQRLGIVGMIGTLTGCFILRQWIKDRSDAQEALVRGDAAERINPDDYALEDEG